MRALLATMVIANPPIGQGMDLGELEERIGRGLPLCDLQWKTGEGGELWMKPHPEAGPEWGPVFVERDGDPYLSCLQNVGVGAAGFVLPGSRDLASLADASFMLGVMGWGTGEGAVRMRIATPVTAERQGPARREALGRILAVRLVQEHGLEEARPELQEVVADGGADPFLRRAARDALLALNGARPPATPVPDGVAAAVPAGADLVSWVDQRRVPEAFFLPGCLRELGMRLSCQDILLSYDDPRAPERVSPDVLASAQKLADTVCLLPHELAWRFGNARMDWTLGALMLERDDWGVWVRAGGLFESRFCAGAIEAHTRLEPERVGGGFRLQGLPFGLRAEMMPDRLWVWSEGTAEGQDPDQEETGRARGLGEAAVWLHVPGGSLLFRRLGLPLRPTTATLTADFGESIVVRLEMPHDSEEMAARSAALLEDGIRRGVAVLESLEPGPAVDEAVGILNGVGLELEEATLHGRMRIHGVDPEDVRAVLGRLLLGSD